MTTGQACFKAIVRRVGGKVAAAATGLAESHLSKATSPDDPGDRHLRREHKDALLKLANPAERVAVFNARLRPFGYQVAAINPRTVERRLAELEFAIATQAGPVGLAIVEQERAKP